MLGIRRILTVTGATTIIGAGYYYQNDVEKAARPLKFWSHMFPIYMHYRFVEWKQKHISGEKDEEWQDLHAKYAPKVLKVILDLRGIYIKVGQVMASREDIAPEIYRNA